MTALRRSSNSPRNFEPATIAPISSASTLRPSSSAGDVAGDDALREALSDGGLSDAGTAYQHRVVLRAADQRLHGAGDLDFAPYDGVQPSTLGKLGQVDAEPFQRLIAALCPGVVDSVAASDLPQGLIDALQLDPELDHDAAGVALVFLHEGHQQVLGPNELVV